MDLVSRALKRSAEIVVIAAIPVATLLAMGLLFGACIGDDDSGTICLPHCDERFWGQSDGCGGQCSCPSGAEEKNLDLAQGDAGSPPGTLGWCWAPETECPEICEEHQTECGEIVLWTYIFSGGAITETPTCDCGSCAVGEMCTTEGICAACQYDCDNMECGPDGCGGECGHCYGGATCLAGKCTSGKTWVDPSSGLEWLVEPSSVPLDLEAASSSCQNLSLRGSTWRLPHIGELRSLIRDCPGTSLDSASCGIEPGQCLEQSCIGECHGCSTDKGPADGCYWPAEIDGTCHIAHQYFLSSTPISDQDGLVWTVSFRTGGLAGISTGSKASFFCVH